jgi:hypothetical protein
MPTTELTNYSALDTMKMFTSLETRLPIRPMTRKEPIAERSRRVIWPSKLVAPNTDATAKKALAMLARPHRQTVEIDPDRTSDFKRRIKLRSTDVSTVQD